LEACANGRLPVLLVSVPLVLATIPLTLTEASAEAAE
jgi:hypothetical protein